jgi:hypothetical protein
VSKRIKCGELLKIVKAYGAGMLLTNGNLYSIKSSVLTNQYILGLLSKWHATIKDTQTLKTFIYFTTKIIISLYLQSLIASR